MLKTGIKSSHHKICAFYFLAEGKPSRVYSNFIHSGERKQEFYGSICPVYEHSKRFMVLPRFELLLDGCKWTVHKVKL